MKKNKLAHKPSVLSVSSLVILGLYSLLLISVFIWAILFSLTDFMDDIYWGGGHYLVWPEKFRFDNLTKVADAIKLTVKSGGGTREVGLLEMFGNSILYAVGSGFAMAAAPCLMGYITARFDFKFNKVIDAAVLISMILPIVGSLPSTINIVYGIKLNDNFLGLWILSFGFTNMYYFIFKASFSGIGKAYSEAAEIDGASNITVFFQIMLPLVKTTFMSIFLIAFVRMWNDYNRPLAFAPNLPTASFGLFRFLQNTRVNEPPLKMMGSMMLMIPILTFFAIFNKKLMGNLTVGGVKG